MNLEMDDAAASPRVSASPRMRGTSAAAPQSFPSPCSSVRKSQVFQRRLKEKISESRALELLDRKIKSDRVTSSSSSCTAEMANSNQDNNEDELVCDSTMVRFEASATPEVDDQRVCGILKTVRGINRQRARDQQTPSVEKENQLSRA